MEEEDLFLASTPTFANVSFASSGAVFIIPLPTNNHFCSVLGLGKTFTFLLNCVLSKLLSADDMLLSSRTLEHMSMTLTNAPLMYL